MSAVRHESGIVVYRVVPEVLSWSDTEVVVRLFSNTVSGNIAFVDLNWLGRHHAWARQDMERIKTAMNVAGCPYRPAPLATETELPTEPALFPATSYKAGAPHILELAVEPLGTAARSWSSNSAHLDAARVFQLRWNTLNAETLVLRGTGIAAQILAAAGLQANFT